MPGAYNPDELATHRHFVTLIQEACDSLDVRATWLGDKWIAQLAGATTCYIEGYTFPLNNAVASALCRDKTATATVLAHSNIPAIPHLLLRPGDTPLTKTVQQTLAAVPLPLVIKPNSENGGRDVYKCATAGGVRAALGRLLPRYRALAVGPLVEVASEYRVVMLDGRALLMFEKIRAAGQWQHNLALGAVPHIVDDPALQPQLAAFAASVMAALNGRLGVVDIAATATGLQVMEINGGVTLSHFSQHSAEYRKRAVAVYREIIAASLEL